MEPVIEKKSLVQRARHELIEYLAICTYLYICFAALIFFKATILRGHGIEYEAIGLAIVKALVLGKFILLAHKFKFGAGQWSVRPIFEILRKAVLFMVLLVALSIAEEVITGLFHGRSGLESIGTMADGYAPQAFATSLLMLLILMPYFAFREISTRLGDGVLLGLLIQRDKPKA